MRLAEAGVDAIITDTPADRAAGARPRVTRDGSGHDEREHVGLVAEVEPVDLAEVVAVDLVRERLVAGDRRAR